MIKKKYQFVDKLPWWMFRNMQHIFVSSNSNESAFKHQDRCDLRSSSFQFDQNASQSNVTQLNTHKFPQTQTFIVHVQILQFMHTHLNELHCIKCNLTFVSLYFVFHRFYLISAIIFCSFSEFHFNNKNYNKSDFFWICLLFFCSCELCLLCVQ